MYLLDTSIVAELRKAKSGRADAPLVGWASDTDRHRLFLSSVTLLALETGAVRIARRDKAAGAAVRNWIDRQVLPAFEGRILPVDAAIVRRRAQLPLAEDRSALIAATALEHGLTLVTRDPAAFRGCRAKLFNPSDYDPDRIDEEADWGQAARTGPLWLRNLFIRT
jgi:hypothetical protein